MDALPWVTITHTSSDCALQVHPHAFTDLPVDKLSTPQIVVFIGKHEKSHVLRELLQGDTRYPQLPHGQVYVWPDPMTRLTKSPTIFLDCELHSSNSTHWKDPISYTTPELSRKISWLSYGDQTKVCAYFTQKVLFPMSTMLYYFAADLGGTVEVANLLAWQLSAPQYAAVPHAILPSIVVITDDDEKELFYDTTTRFVESLVHACNILHPFQTDSEIRTSIRSRFGSLRAISAGQVNRFARSDAIRDHMQSNLHSLIENRRFHRYLFIFSHMQAFSSVLLENFCSHPTSEFSFIKASRAQGFDADEFATHLKNLLILMPSEAWLWHFIAPMVASCLFLSTYPLNAHLFCPLAAYEELFQTACSHVIGSYTIHENVQHKFVDTVKRELKNLFDTLVEDQGQTALDLHTKQYISLRPHIGRLKSNRTCLTCLMRMPERVLHCGHSICDICLKVRGRKDSSGGYVFKVKECLVCGKVSDQSFRLIPPTAGVRLLSVDGGGVRGIIPIIFLRHLEASLQTLGCPLSEYFDLVCGTSAGGLVTIGIFLMHWTANESVQKFQLLAKQIFKRRNTGSSMFARFQELLMSYVEDGQYSQQAINDAFLNSGKPVPMFNPLCNHTRVAVTSTTAKGTRACLFTNYNGRNRPEDSVPVGYDIIRAQRAEFDVTVSDAARCTSAAPWYFKPQNLKELGTYQDGGLQHNMPMDVAYWEKHRLWPEKQGVDFGLSLGTGARKASLTTRIGPQSPVKEGCALRIFNAFLERIDGEREWWRFRNSLPLDVRDHFYRLNITLPGKEPSIDDISSIQSLKTETELFLKDNPSCITNILDSIYASIFYFELDCLPEYVDGVHFCSGSVQCRLNLDSDGRFALYQWLIKETAYILINGRPILCVNAVPKGLPPFRCRIQFTATDLSERIGISIRGITSKPVLISGLSRSISGLINDQMLYAPFGRIDCYSLERVLPSIPLKRKPGQELDSAIEANRAKRN